MYLFLDLLINRYRIKALYKFYGLYTDLLRVLKVRLQGLFFSLAFPFLGDVYIIQTYKNLYGSSYWKHAAVIFLDRVIYTFALTIIIVPVWLLRVIDVGPYLRIAIIVLLGIEIFIFFVLNKPLILTRLNTLIKRIGIKNESLLPVFEERNGYLKAIFINASVALLRHFLTVIIYLMIAYSLLHHMQFSISRFAFAVFTLVLARVLPVSVGGIGLREYIAVVIFPQIGISADYAFTIAFVISSLAILEGMIGGVTYFLGKAKVIIWRD